MSAGGIFVGGGGAEYAEPRELLLEYANRHGLITGATGTGKTVTLQILAESFSAAGVPVVVQDVKGDVSGLARPGDPAGKAHEALTSRAAKIGMEGFGYRDYPTVFWDLYGEKGHPVRTTISEMGPLLLSRMMDLTDAQEGALNIAFRMADEEGLLLLDLEDLRAMLVWLGENRETVSRTYGNVTTATIGAIQRKLLVLENEGAGGFFGEPHLSLSDLMAKDGDMGRINVLMSDRLMQAPRLYAMFLLWLLSELFEELPEVGNPDKPVLVFFFDEAHLLFRDAPKALVDKVSQVVRLIRSKGVGVYFVTQNPDDVPPEVLGQLGNRIQHALRAFTPRDKKALRMAAETFRPNPAFDTETAIREVGTGEAVVSLLEDKGVPAMVSRVLIRPPMSRMGPLTEGERLDALAASPLAGRYDTAIDRESAAEMLAERAEASSKDVELAEKMLAELEAKKSTQQAPPASSRARRYEAPNSPSRRSSSSASAGSGLAKMVVKQLSTREGQRLVRGILGSLFKGR
ncbi:helicase HerA-like domain-containing protein [Amaricoccus macauensis]|uniref:helicase HerA-like domain-containing protein n=1 Tax=Amaricoccus macauensis TaxID=57001 RepID=UPI003C7CF036